MITKNDNGSSYNNYHTGDLNFFWHNYMCEFLVVVVSFVPPVATHGHIS
jgi:hypothetical protein